MTERDEPLKGFPNPQNVKATQPESMTLTRVGPDRCLGIWYTPTGTARVVWQKMSACRARTPLSSSLIQEI